MTIAGASLSPADPRLRNHPSVLVWLNGSDNPPPPNVEQMYLAILNEQDWPNPFALLGLRDPTPLTGPSGVKMTGPYDYVPPELLARRHASGGAYGFNTETSPGPGDPAD